MNNSLVLIISIYHSILIKREFIQTLHTGESLKFVITGAKKEERHIIIRVVIKRYLK